MFIYLNTQNLTFHFFCFCASKKSEAFVLKTLARERKKCQFFKPLWEGWEVRTRRTTNYDFDLHILAKVKSTHEPNKLSWGAIEEAEARKT